MKTLLLALLLTQTLEWKHIPEASGVSGDGLRVNTSVAKIARSEDIVKFWLRVDFPDGAPSTFGFSFDSVRVEATFNCKKKTAKTRSKGMFYLNGDLVKTLEDKSIAKETHGSVGHFIFETFCEQGSQPTTTPTLKPKG